MASGRVGGTRSKKRGQVGGTIYQVVRNADGTYTQISYGKPEDVTQTITPRLQAQRMCTSMVEALMRDLKPVATISMQSAANKSKSLNAFSAYNLQIVARDCKEHWDGHNRFFYPATIQVGEPDEELGGLYMLSSGTWQYNGFDEVVYIVDPWRVWPSREFIGKRFAGMRFRLRSSDERLEDFLRRHYMSPLDSLCFACFHDWQDSDPETEDPIYYTRHSYIIAQLNSNIPGETIVTPEILDQLFVCSSDWDVFKRVSADGIDYYIGVLVDNEADNAYIYTMGAFTISYLEGKKKISSSTFKMADSDIEAYFLDGRPCDVFGSWMGTPAIKPYPNIFI